MFYSNKLTKFNNIKHCFFSKKNGYSKGVYHSLNCGPGSKDKKKNIVVPGQSKVHYSPGIPIRLNVNEPRSNEAFILIKKRKLYIMER